MFEIELENYLLTLGASVVGFADLREVTHRENERLNYGVSIAIKLNPDVITGIKSGPTLDYFNEYKRVNKELDNISILCSEFIKDCGYEAIAQTSTFNTTDDKLSTPLPHKTVATRAGLGWIGKSALLVTEEFGSAIRLTSVITDMPLIGGVPINQSKCGSCISCVKACPGEAIKGELWNISISRDELIDPHKCRKKARELLNEKIGVESAICGKCIEVCPYTIRYLKKGR